MLLLDETLTAPVAKDCLDESTNSAASRLISTSTDYSRAYGFYSDCCEKEVRYHCIWLSHPFYISQRYLMRIYFILFVRAFLADHRLKSIDFMRLLRALRKN
uniref:Uncharacterized protein n=1 Tax=Parascaris univalens TaxID=6257 RepID=A0A915B3E2_PARUN